ncbi:hypothetical protein V8E52_004782 [Russula decolorans]
MAVPEVPPLRLPSFIPFLLSFRSLYGSVLQSVCARRTLPVPFSFLDTGCPLACRHRSPAHVPISRLAPRTPARSSWKTCIHFNLYFPSWFWPIPLQTYLDFNAIYILIEVAKFPNPGAPGVPALVETGSWVRSRTSHAGSSGYSVSFVAMRSSTLIIVIALP